MMIIQKIINKPKEQFILEFDVCPYIPTSKYEWYLKAVYHNVGKEPDDDFNEERFTLECSEYFGTEAEAVKDLEQVLNLLGIE